MGAETFRFTIDGIEVEASTGQSAPNPILTTMRAFPEAYEARLATAPFEPRVTLNDALREAVAVQGREPVPQEI